MALHPLQKPVDNLIDYLRDAYLLYEIIEKRNRALAEQRQSAGTGSGGGPPTAAHRSLNRAAVVAAVGALEAFCEDLALTAQNAIPGNTPPSSDWYKIEGAGGMVQTPSPKNIRKLFWTFFRYDPQVDWDISVQVSDVEMGTVGGSGWRVHSKQYLSADVATFFDTMVKVRHGFAHQDTTSRPRAFPGITTHTPGGKVAIHSHHAWNSICALVQFAILTTRGLAISGGLGTDFRWSSKMDGFEWLECINKTTAGGLVKSEWKKAPAALK